MSGSERERGDGDGRGQNMRVDTGCVVACTPGADFDIRQVDKVKAALFRGLLGTDDE